MKILELKIDGMKCSMCESHVNDLIRKINGVKKVKSDHLKGISTVVIEDNTSIDDIKSILNNDGYRVLSEEVFEAKKTLFGYKKA